MKAQGWEVKDNLLLQDNNSSIKLEINGKASSSNRTRHINIRYFFIADRVQKGDVRIAYCPTEEMVADFFTKPLQGSTFRKFRDYIMNIEPDAYNSHNNMHHRSVLKKVNNKTNVKVSGIKHSANRYAILEEEEDVELTDGTDVVKYGTINPIIRKIPAAE